MPAILTTSPNIIGGAPTDGASFHWSTCWMCCRRIIRPGETYLVHFSVFEGDATSEKCCSECEAARKTFAAAHEGWLFTPGFLMEMLQECIGDSDDDGNPQWSAMLARIHAERQKAKTSTDRSG